MDNLTQKQIEDIKNIRNNIYYLGLQHQQKMIQQHSPYSNDITQYIKQYDELRLYFTLHLQESHITRPTIIRDLDFDLWISSENCSNLDLMKKGHAPYEFDAPEGKIELHHIGQDYNAPFAELTWEEHEENNKLLHLSRQTSWRQNTKLEKQFQAERADYWRKRAKQDYSISEFQTETLPVYNFHRHEEYSNEIRKTCEVLYSQCESEDLDYLSDLAKSYAMMQQIGSKSLSDFLQNAREKSNVEVGCTCCGSVDYVLHGTYQTASEKIQRYKCQKCGKVYSLFHRSLISGSSFSFREWLKFIDCLYNGYTIKQIAVACDVSERTAQENRMKLFFALKLLNDKVQLKGKVVLDETYIPLSYKGNHSKQADFVMPRDARRRGGENHQKGLSKELVSIVCAMDEFGNSVAKITGTGPASGLKLKYALHSHISEEITCLYSDKSTSIRKFAELSGYEIKQEKFLHKRSKQSSDFSFSKDTLIVNRYLQIMNSYHSRLKRFLSRFSGISTKYLSGYLYLFAWRERSKNLNIDDVYKELLQIMTTPNNYLSADEIVQNNHFPYPQNIDSQYRIHTSRNLERDKEIYHRYANGETMVSIGLDVGLSAKQISYIIKNLRKNGLAYRTQRDIRREQKGESKTSGLYNNNRQSIIDRNIKIFQDKTKWEGTTAAFNEKTSRKYNLSVSRIKNIVSQMKRIQKLTDEILVYEDTSYRSSKEVYQAIYTDWLSLQTKKPKLSKTDIATVLANKYNFSSGHIQWIIQLMKNDPAGEYFQKKRKLTKVETYNRDKALFIDFLRWNGTKRDFCTYASQKYNISEGTVYEILQYCLFADPKRYDMA